MIFLPEQKEGKMFQNFKNKKNLLKIIVKLHLFCTFLVKWKQAWYICAYYFLVIYKHPKVLGKYPWSSNQEDVSDDK